MAVVKPEDEEKLLVELIEYIKHKYPAIEVDSEIYYTSYSLKSKMSYRLQHKETKEVLGIVFDMSAQLYTTIVIQEALERICEQLTMKKHTLTELQELLNRYPIDIVLK